MSSNLVRKYSNNTTEVYISDFISPVGKLTAAADNNYMFVVAFEDSKNYEKMFGALAKQLSCKYLDEKNVILKRFEEDLTAYFTGKTKKFTVPLKMIGSEFQQSVWNKLLDIPFGSTETYSDLAISMGRSVSHSRAVGAACGANPLLLVVPCHRVIGTKSKGGFSSGTDRKEMLLAHERTLKEETT